MKGRVELTLLKRLREEGAIHLTLLDPIDLTIEEAVIAAEQAESFGSAALMVGGSTVFSQIELDRFVREVKEHTSLPVIIFPSNVSSVVPSADAIWFISLLNSVEWYYLVGAQLQGAPLVKRYGLESLPMGYIVFGGETAVAMIGRALPLNPKNGEVASVYALAAEMMGMRYVYLEAGSGASEPIPPETIRTVRKVIDITLVVGGGIRTPETAEKAVEMGADIIVTGNSIKLGSRLNERIVDAVKRAGRRLAGDKTDRIERLVKLVMGFYAK